MFVLPVLKQLELAPLYLRLFSLSERVNNHLRVSASFPKVSPAPGPTQVPLASWLDELLVLMAPVHFTAPADECRSEVPALSLQKAAGSS